MEIFELQKIITLFASPLGFSILLALLGVLLSRRWIVLIAIAWLWFWSTPLFVQRLAERVEAQNPLLPTADLPDADVILVLGGALSPAVPGWHPEINLGQAADRVMLTAQLYRLGKASRVLFSGGPKNQLGGSEAQSGAELLELLGVPSTAITIENNSRTTRENVTFSMPLLQSMGARRVLLVTSALHLPRSLINFREAAAQSGLDIVFLPAPCDPIELVHHADPVRRWVPDSESLHVSHSLFKETLGTLHALWLK